MKEDATNGRQYPLENLSVVQATAGMSPVPGLVRVSLDITPGAASDLALRCDRGYQAGLAGQLSIESFYARYGRPFVGQTNKPLGIIPRQRRANEPGDAA